jgi:hypothetical protein
MVYFRTKNPNLGKFWMALEWKMFVYFMVIWNILRPFGIPYGQEVMLWSFDKIFPILVYCVKKNLATLLVLSTCSAFFPVFLLRRRPLKSRPLPRAATTHL